MGNCCSKTVGTWSSCVSSCYPTHRYLQPGFLTTVVLAGMNAYRLTCKQALRLTHSCQSLNYLLSLGGLFGIQFWKIFVDGPTNLFSLSRETSYQYQNTLAPKYSALTVLASGVGLFVFLQRVPLNTWSGTNAKLGYALLTSFTLNALNTTCFYPQTLRLFGKMIEVEKENGVEVDKMMAICEPSNDALTKSDTYKNLNRRFGLMHFLTATSTMVSFGCTLSQLYLVCKHNYFTF